MGKHSTKTKIVVTLGPSTNTEESLRMLKDRGVDFVRVNMSHSSIEDQRRFMKMAREVGVPFILDTEGSQVRNGAIANREVSIEEGDIVNIYKEEIVGDKTRMSLRPGNIVTQLEEGDLIYVDFDSLVFRVLDISPLKTNGYVVASAITGGQMGMNKGVVIDSASKKKYDLPALSPKDLEAIQIALKEGVEHIAVSFVRSPETVDLVRKVSKNRMKIISKIECVEALESLDKIIDKSDFLLIDRGDLSREVPIERIPFTQKIVMDRARKKKKGVFVATNLLESMVQKKNPTRAEVHDVIQTILDGAYGLTLAAETAIGKYPIEVITTINKLIDQAERFVPAKVRPVGLPYVKQLDTGDYLLSGSSESALVEPNGGVLVDRVADSSYTPKKGLHTLQITDEQHMDIEQIAIGTFSPLEGFLGKKDLESVLSRMRLANGVIWPMPIVLDASEEEAKKMKLKQDVALTNKKGETVGILHLKEKYTYDREKFVQKMYGTKDPAHPGVAEALTMKPLFLAGKITLLKRFDSPTKRYELTPRQSRRLFVDRGWAKIVAFHTRNAIHRGHEFIQLEALRRSFADGLFIHPIVGKKKKGDFEAETIVASYALMMKQFYRKHSAVFGTYATFSRYAGPREALFTAICRQNFGCSHFIIGRDHTGVGNFYAPTASHDIFEKFPDLGIVPVKFNHVFYSEKERRHVHEADDTSKHNEGEKLHISGTEARKTLLSGKKLPEWFMRPEISELILDLIKKGKKVFVE